MVVADLLHGGEDVVYIASGYQATEKRSEMVSKEIVFRTGIELDKCKDLPNSPDVRLMSLIEVVIAVTTSACSRPHPGPNEAVGRAWQEPLGNNFLSEELNNSGSFGKSSRRA
jgi:hypothetical protein